MEESNTTGSRHGEPPPWALGVVDELLPALRADFGTERLCAPDGWRLDGVAPRHFRSWVVVVTLAHDADRLCFIVTPTDPRTPAYVRTARHDLAYFSEDVPDDAQHQIYRRDRPMIDAFARWLEHHDGAAARSG